MILVLGVGTVRFSACFSGRPCKILLALQAFAAPSILNDHVGLSSMRSYGGEGGASISGIRGGGGWCLRCGPRGVNPVVRFSHKGHFNWESPWCVLFSSAATQIKINPRGRDQPPPLQIICALGLPFRLRFAHLRVRADAFHFRPAEKPHLRVEVRGTPAKEQDATLPAIESWRRLLPASFYYSIEA